MELSVPTSDIELLTQALFHVMPGLWTWAAAVTLHTIRFAVALMILPVTADGVLNDASRMGIAAILALYVALGRPPGELAALGSAALLLVVVKELVLGVALGFAMSTVFWVIEYVGALVDNIAGFNSVQIQNPMRSDSATPVSILLLNLAGALFFALGGAMFFAQAMFESFLVWPVAELAPSAQGAYVVFVERQLNALFANTLKLAAPILIIAMLIDVGMGLLSRSAEKLEPANLSQPIKSIVAILLVLLMVGTVFEPLRQHLLPRGVVQQMLPAPAASPQGR